jgi:hypothetical protein
MKTAYSFALYFALLVVVAAWIGQQFAFPLVPALGRLARRLPDSVQMFCIFTLLTVSLVGTIYFFTIGRASASAVGQRVRPRSFTWKNLDSPTAPQTRNSDETFH